MPKCSLEDLYNIYYNGLNKIEFKEHRTFYHYTSPSALTDILSNDFISLRFSRFDCLNDTTEGKHVIEIYRESCKELLNNGEINKSFYELVENIEPSEKQLFFEKKGNQNVGGNKQFNVYLCCFSLNKDALPMWNYYVKNNKYEGYSIGFDELLFESFSKKTRVYSFYQNAKSDIH